VTQEFKRENLDKRNPRGRKVIGLTGSGFGVILEV
jgi:hypothetical protein